MRFSDVISAGDHNAFLKGSVDNGTLPHALLLWGPEGTGKLATALALSQYLMCKDKQEGGSCGKCSNCLKNRQLLHPDLHFSFPGYKLDSRRPYVSTDHYPEWRKAVSENPYLDRYDWMEVLQADRKQLNISVAECQRLIEQMSLRSFEGSYKILVMWLAEYLALYGNTLLKLIEEPPDNTHIILIAEDRDAILPTVLSRCQQLYFGPVPPEVIKASLQRELDIDADRAVVIADNCHGNWNLAKRMAERREFNPVSWMQSWIKAAWSSDPGSMRSWADGMSRVSREENKQYMRYVLDVLQKLFWIKWDIDFRADSDEMKMLKWLNTKVEFNELEDLASLIEENLAAIERNARPNLVWMDATLKLRTALRTRHGEVGAKT